MGAIKNAINKHIDENNFQTYKGTTGRIEEFNSSTNTATVSFTNESGLFTIQEVPISNMLGGVCGFYGIRAGLDCMLEFRNGNVYSPVITGVYENFDSEKDMSDQGSLIIDSDILDLEEPQDIKPMAYDWIDKDNEHKDKYINEYSEFIDCDIDKLSYDIIHNITHFKDNEQGLINMFTKSGIKLKDNGDIDIFVDNNSGIRISAKNKTVTVYGLEIKQA